MTARTQKKSVRGTAKKLGTTKPSFKPKIASRKPSTVTNLISLNRTTETRRSPNVNNLTRRMGLMSIPRPIETRGTILGTNRNNTLKVQLPRTLVAELEGIYTGSASPTHGRMEFAGIIECTFDMNYANFTTPTIRTNYQMASVRFPERTRMTKMTYHTHPSPPAPPGSTYTSIPSGSDFNAYIRTHRNGVIEANIILEQQGMYVIDVLRPINRDIGEDIFNAIIEKIQSAGGINYTVEDSILVFNLNIGRWKRFMNNTLDPFLVRQYGVSIKFYKWNELPQVRISSLPRR